MADPTKKRYDLRLNTSIDATHMAMLNQLAIEDRSSKAAIVRGLIFVSFETVFRSAPHCANGNKCLCPQMHVPHPTASETTAQTLDRIKLGRRPTDET